MRTARTHPVIGLVALAAYLLNMAAAAGGAVLCHDPAGAASIEIACDHDHCATTVESEPDHDHDAGGCWCSGCPCEDTPLAVDVVPLRKDDDVRGSTPDASTFVLVPRFEVPPRTARALVLADRPPSVVDRSLRQLRTVVLVV